MLTINWTKHIQRRAYNDRQSTSKILSCMYNSYWCGFHAVVVMVFVSLVSIFLHSKSACSHWDILHKDKYLIVHRQCLSQPPPQIWFWIFPFFYIHCLKFATQIKMKTDWYKNLCVVGLENELTECKESVNSVITWSKENSWQDQQLVSNWKL